MKYSVDTLELSVARLKTKLLELAITTVLASPEPAGNIKSTYHEFLELVQMPKPDEDELPF